MQKDASLDVTRLPGSVWAVLSGCWAAHLRWRDEEIEVALSRSPFPTWGDQLLCVLVFAFS